MIENWIQGINSSYDENKILLNKIKTKHNNIKLNKKLKWKCILNKSKNNNDFYYGTIHSAKGKTFENVLLILNCKSVKNLGKKQLLEDEELRTIYVGMSRAKYKLWIAVPEKCYESCKHFFNDKTFQSSLSTIF